MASGTINIYGELSDLRSRPKDCILVQETNAASHTINLSNSSRNVVIVTGVGATRTYVGMLYCGSDGAMTVHEISKGSNVSIDISENNKATFTFNSASAAYIRCINIRGDLPTNG